MELYATNHAIGYRCCEMRNEECLICGRVGLASFNRHENPELNHDDLEMLKYGWNAIGSYLGKYRCIDRKSCNARKRMIERSPIVKNRGSV